MSVESHGGMTLTWEKRRMRRKICPSAALWVVVAALEKVQKGTAILRLNDYHSVYYGELRSTANS
jgi:hypothetical protein